MMERDIELERVLRYFDEDGDGKISPEELQRRLSLIGGEVPLKEAEMAIEALDSDGDGLVSLEDMKSLVEGGSEDCKLNDLREAFKMYDEEGCGFITPNNLKRMLGKLGESKTIEECRAMITPFDLNGDGMLSFEEFLSIGHLAKYSALLTQEHQRRTKIEAEVCVAVSNPSPDDTSAVADDPCGIIFCTNGATTASSPIANGIFLRQIYMSIRPISGYTRRSFRVSHAEAASDLCLNPSFVAISKPSTDPLNSSILSLSSTSGARIRTTASSTSTSLVLRPESVEGNKSSELRNVGFRIEIRGDKQGGLEPQRVGVKRVRKEVRGGSGWCGDRIHHCLGQKFVRLIGEKTDRYRL
ncbi:putative calcium-binding protein CML19 [Senna tora]|uniref:Putative calcium-binding protein CML19 n=1 Tax=Senna tora TaxID=362788 RepID=A0A835C9A5_9FABA|nr:putative calcium-binding protein CML19 [Senna tora]